MRMTKHYLLPTVWAVLTVLTVAACSTAKSGYSALRSDYSSWEGHSSTELLNSWGPPDAIKELATDYEAYTWNGDDGVCQRTFMIRTGKISGYSESNC